MYVEDVEDGVYSFYVTLYAELLILLLMSKVSKMLNTMNNWSKTQNTYKHVFAHTFLNIQLIFNPQKVLENWDPMHVEDYLWHLQYALVYTVFDGMVGKFLVSAFQNILRIENQLNIKKVISKDVCVCSFPHLRHLWQTLLYKPLCVFDLSSTSLT